MTQETIVTAELLAGLTKCPFCGAERTGGTKEGWRFDCGTFQILGRKQSEYRVARCIEISEATLRARVKELEEALNQIANQDYRGNRSVESQIAYAALKKGTK